MWSKQNGFSLVELIVVLVVVGVIAGTVAVSINQSDDNAKTANAAHAILSDLRYVQELAMANRREARFVISGGTGGAYAATWVDNNSSISRSNAEGANDISVSFSEHDDFDGLTISVGSASNISFTSTGAPEISGTPFEAGTDLTVVSINDSKTIKITPGTGYTYIE